MNGQCPTCGHHFYSDPPKKDGRCQFCHEDDAQADVCIYCGAPARCTGQYGYMCFSENCDRREKMQLEFDFMSEEDDL